ncbi:hypothetical protein [Halomontanus rarus]|uniref:hypothetical protein n=1 Tax=Halomontanus rarus TaxID=3034020 RepID=UPI0023E8680B|nr:hypothetical protein [Halovivax sp. TS33]
MTTTRYAHETISDEPISENIILERPRPAYGYLGRDGDGYHHHVDRATDTVYISENKYERFLPENALTYWICVRGETHTIVDLESVADLEAWIDRVNTTTGWKEQPADLRVLLTRGESA